MVLVTPNCFLCDCKVCTEEEKGEDGKRLKGHSIFGMLLVSMAAIREPSVAGWDESRSHLAGLAERQSSRRGRQEKNSGVWKKRKEEEFMHLRAVPFRRDKRLVRNRHPVCCLEHQKDVKASKLRPDGSRGWCDTTLWLRECCLSSHRPLVHLVAEPAQSR